MTDNKLLTTLQHLEEELHPIKTRRNPNRMQDLLQPDFEEFGRSGRRYSRGEILSEFSKDAELSRVISQYYRLTRLGTESALLTYVSAHLNSAGELYRHTLRSTLWLRTAVGWQMRFHQGTPTQP